jgi:riboflavin biosynthesis pyrimidine reductase
MRALLPEPADEVDLAAAYPYPPGRRWLRANMVASVDGAVTVDGRSGGLSTPADKRVFAVLRGLCDAVLVGAGTVRAEGYGAVRAATPVLAVVTGSLDLDPDSALFRDAVARTLLVTTEAAAARRGDAFAAVADVVTTPGERVDVPAAVEALHRRGLSRLLCEGGPALLAQVAAGGVLDELCLTVAPSLVAGAAGRILAGPVLDPPLPLQLAGVLEEEGTLFTRWTRSGGSRGPGLTR